MREREKQREREKRTKGVSSALMCWTRLLLWEGEAVRDFKLIARLRSKQLAVYRQGMEIPKGTAATRHRARMQQKRYPMLPTAQLFAACGRVSIYVSREIDE